MQMSYPLAAMLACAGTLTGVALAQPTVNEDFGALSDGVTVSRPIALSGATIFWYRFTVPAIASGSGIGQRYLDIRTAEPGGGTIPDTEIGLYAASGAFATGVVGTSSDDDDGPGNASALSYGLTCPTRPNAGAGTQSAGATFDGRDGALAAGTYYLAVAPYNATFATNFAVTPGSQTGNVTLEITLGTSTTAAPAPTLSAATSGPSPVASGSNALITVTAAACGRPDTVTIDLSAFGGSAATPLLDNGANGDAAANDNIFSGAIAIPGSVAPGAYTLTATGTNAQGSATFNVTINVVAPGTTLAAAAGIYTEAEDNDSKARANRIAAMLDNEAITGTSTGSSTTTAGTTSIDQFRVTTAPAALGIYRHRLTITTTGTAGHTGSIRGLSQSGGAINIAADTAFQTSSTTTTPARFNQWYGFGKAESIFYRVTGASTTTAPYVSTLTSDTITPVDLGAFQAGSLIITTIGQGHTNDTDLWVYDAGLNAIANFGNDDESVAEGGTGATTQSRLSRTFGAGTYYLTLSNYNTANNLPSPSTDDFLGADVLDFPNVIANSNTTTVANLGFAVIDSAGSHAFPASKPGPFDIYWARFTVQAASACGTADFNGDGDIGTDQDIEAFFACLAGNCCATCFPGGADFNGDGDIGTDQDIEAFFRVLAGNPC